MAFPPAPENNGRTNDDVTGRSSETYGGRQLWEKQLKEGDIMVLQFRLYLQFQTVLNT